MHTDTQSRDLPLLSRAEAEKVLGIRRSTLRSWQENAGLEPARRGPDGVVYYRREDLELLAMRARERAARPTPQGEKCARIYEAFARGLLDRDVVVALRVTPWEVAALRARWLDGGAWLDGAQCARLRELASELGRPLELPSGLADWTRALVDQFCSFAAELSARKAAALEPAIPVESPASSAPSSSARASSSPRPRPPRTPRSRRRSAARSSGRPARVARGARSARPKAKPPAPPRRSKAPSSRRR